MNISNSNSEMTRASTSIFDAVPFNIIDVGCSGGIDRGWEIFGRNCNVFAFDPQQSEIEKLSKIKYASNVLYECYWVKQTGKSSSQNKAVPYFDPQEPWKRSSAAAGSALMSNKHQQSNPINENLTEKEISIDDYVTMRNLETVDFIKIDCDGGDLEAIRSGLNTIREKKVKALLVEVNWAGGTDENSNTYHNIDRLLKEYGFQPFAIEQNMFSKAALPRPFKYSIFAQTKAGQPVQGDVLFVRDCAAKDFEDIAGKNWDPIDYFKTACLFELFGLQDCAAEILVNKREYLKKLINVDNNLDILAKELYPKETSYKTFMNKFNSDPEMLFPLLPHETLLETTKAAANTFTISGVKKIFPALLNVIRRFYGSDRSTEPGRKPSFPVDEALSLRQKILIPLLIFASIILFVLLSNKDWLFATLGWLDTWYCLAYGYDYGHPDFLNDYYKIARLPWIWTEYIVRHLFPPLAAGYILTVGMLSLSSLGSYFCMARLLGWRIGLGTAFVMAAYVQFHGNRCMGGWDYQNALSFPLFFATLYLFIEMGLAQSAIRSLWLSFAAGIFYGLTVHTNILFVNHAIILASMYVFLRWETGRQAIFSKKAFIDAAMVFAGALAITLFMCTVNRLIGRDFFFFRLLFNQTNALITENHWWHPFSDGWIKKATYLALPVALVAISIVLIPLLSLKRCLTTARKRTAFIVLLQSLTLIAIWTFWQCMKQTMLDWKYLAYPMLVLTVPALFSLGVFWERDVRKPRHPIYILGIYCVISFLILFVPILLGYETKITHLERYFGTWTILYPAILFIFAGISFLLSRWQLFFAVGLLFISIANLSDTSPPDYAFSSKKSINKDHYKALVAVRKTILKREHVHRKNFIVINSDEKDERFPQLYLASAEAATGFGGYINWLGKIKLADLTPENIQKNHVDGMQLVVFSQKEDFIKKLIAAHAALGFILTQDKETFLFGDIPFDVYFLKSQKNEIKEAGKQ